MSNQEFLKPIKILVSGRDNLLLTFTELTFLKLKIERLDMVHAGIELSLMFKCNINFSKTSKKRR